ncbi:cell wall-binding repeat-containing protein [Clostridium thailandense]|uniref:cell wall-binding repeat-containing protein n=1 Tax=Clostridium thailandense TaxID=2794346 RepID=UPI003989343F
MNKIIKKGLASISLTSLFITVALLSNIVHADQAKVTRIGEVDRYATAAKVATTNWTTSDSVILVSGEGYADAVSASVLAKKLNAPILLTTPNTLNPSTKAALSTLKAKKVYVLGGNASVGQSVRYELRNNNYDLVELQGANRYETNLAVAKQLVALGVKADNLMLVGGEGYSDALSVAPVAAAKEQILLLGNNDDNSMKSVIEFIKFNNSKVTVVGTKNVINEDIYNALGAVERVDGGADRFDTNMNVLTKFSSDLKDGQTFIANASGDGYADALVAADLAGKSASPLVLFDTPYSQATTKALDYVKEKSPKMTAINIIGGIGVVSKDTEDAINSALGDSVQSQIGISAAQPSIVSIEQVNLNQIHVVFNGPVNHSSAIDVTNYEINGSKLVPCTSFTNIAQDENAAKVYYADPFNVYITLAYPRKQYDKLTFTVRTGILNQDETTTVEGASKDLTLSDTAAPTLKAVTIDGNSVLRVEFSEDVNLKTLNDIKNKFKLDGQSLPNYGINPVYSVLDDAMTITDSSIGPVGTWGNKVTFYLDSPLPTGNHTLKVSDGDKDGVLSDVAGFTFKETTSDFKVDSNSTVPVVKSLIQPEGGRIFVQFDRPMDLQTTTNLSNYELDGTKISQIQSSNPSTFCYLEEPDHSLLKIENLPESVCSNGSNVVCISDKVKDSYGNKIPSDTRLNLNIVTDNTKPKVNSIKIIDSETIRVQYSEVVNYNYATNISNYKLEDNKGTNITNHIKEIVSASDIGNNNYFDIKLNKYNPNDSSDDWRLTSSKYTLTIKNIIDAATTPNVMDDYTTTLNGSDNIAPKAIGIYAKLRRSSSEKDKVVIYFDEAMDSDTLTNKDNYTFINGEGDTKPLPDSTTISTGGDNKSAIIEFPWNYKVTPVGETTNGSSNDVTAITVANVKDESGNTLDTTAYTGVVANTKVGSEVKDNTIKTYYDGNDLKVDVQFDKAIDTVEVDDFTLGGVTPSSASISGDKVTLVYKDGDLATDADKKAAPTITFYNGKTNNDSNTTKIDLVKSQGQQAYLGIKVNAKTIDETGTSIASLDDKLVNNKNTIYDYEAAPKTTCSDDNSADFWTAERDSTGTKIFITFDTPIDANSGIKTDDFVFNGSNGTDIKADSVEIKENTLVFSFDTTNKEYDKTLKNAAEIDVKVKGTVSLRTVKDADGNNSNYTPSKDDLKNRSVIVTAK